MPYVITSQCIGTMDKSCVDECPVDCIYEGDKKLYINPFECIDCGACEPACPTNAIWQDRRVPEGEEAHVQDNKDFFELTLLGREGPIGNAGGSQMVGAIGVDTELVRGL
ncbi:MAG: ferredoxin family protein [Actinomycetota bacterium]|jgi:NAD-dependent dihydropyrimidine dehydrogenase PreA subunit|nr:ferredoxin family protein [Actinomycetota bacterium]